MTATMEMGQDFSVAELEAQEKQGNRRKLVELAIVTADGTAPIASEVLATLKRIGATNADLREFEQKYLARKSAFANWNRAKQDRIDYQAAKAEFDTECKAEDARRAAWAIGITSLRDRVTILEQKSMAYESARQAFARLPSDPALEAELIAIGESQRSIHEQIDRLQSDVLPNLRDNLAVAQRPREQFDHGVRIANFVDTATVEHYQRRISEAEARLSDLRQQSNELNQQAAAVREAMLEVTAI